MRTFFNAFRLLCLPAVLSLLLLPGCGKHEKSLKVGIIPYETADQIKDEYGPFATYLGKKTGGQAGQVFVAQEYAGILQALRSDQIDCAYLNPLSYTLAVQEFKDTPEHLIPLAMPYFHHSLTYKGVIFVRADSGIKTLKDFKGRSFAFGDLNSTSSYLYPAGMMQQAGVDPKKDVRAVNISGSNVEAVFNKQADGGAIWEGGVEKELSDPAQQKQMIVIATTDPIPNGMFVARGNLDPATLDKLRQALQDINTDPDGKAALVKIPWDKMVPADDKIFDPVREKAKILNLTLSSLAAQGKK